MTYPIDADGFIANQEKRFGDTIKIPGYSFYEQTVPIINEAYEDGLHGVETGLYPKKYDELCISVNNAVPSFQAAERVRTLVLFTAILCNEAWVQGRRDAGKAVVV